MVNDYTVVIQKGLMGAEPYYVANVSASSVADAAEKGRKEVRRVDKKLHRAFDNCYQVVVVLLGTQKPVGWWFEEL